MDREEQSGEQKAATEKLESANTGNAKNVESEDGKKMWPLVVYTVLSGGSSSVLFCHSGIPSTDFRDPFLSVMVGQADS